MCRPCLYSSVRAYIYCETTAQFDSWELTDAQAHNIHAMQCHSVPCRRIDSLPARCPCTYFQFVSFSCFLLLFAFFVFVKVKKNDFFHISRFTQKFSLHYSPYLILFHFLFFSFLFASSSLSPLWIGCSFICSSSAYFSSSSFRFSFSSFLSYEIVSFSALCVCVCVYRDRIFVFYNILSAWRF